jgi:ATP-binding cassette, subfamily A (ABC1), member 3
VQENLEFFAMLRGVENTEEKILVLLEQFHMSECKENFPDKISGGQKRRLQLMISLLGDFKVILLDEPSSGMDPNLRRETWDILKSLKKDKIIIMTTHYMDEAEYLGDRVAIMSHGKLKTCGSSLFLKNKFSDDLIIEVKKMDVESNLDGFRFLFQTALTELGMKEEQMKVTRE